MVYETVEYLGGPDTTILFILLHITNRIYYLYLFELLIRRFFHFIFFLYKKKFEQRRLIIEVALEEKYPHNFRGLIKNKKYLSCFIISPKHPHLR